MIRRPPRSPLFPSPPLSRSNDGQPPLEPRPRRADRRAQRGLEDRVLVEPRRAHRRHVFVGAAIRMTRDGVEDRKSTRLNSSHGYISYAVFCLKKKKENNRATDGNQTSGGTRRSGLSRTGRSSRHCARRAEFAARGATVTEMYCASMRALYRL